MRKLLASPSATREVLEKYGIHARKKYGQNFLIDGSIVRGIIDAAGITGEDCVLEIGPGIGTMTQLLSRAAGRVVCVETEKRPHTMTVKGGALIVKAAEGKPWSILDLGIHTKSPSVTVYLPAAVYESLQLEADTGRVVLSPGLAFDKVDVDADTGSVSVDGVDVKTLKISNDTGRIKVANMTPQTAELEADTGSIEVTDVVCAGDLRCETDTGSIRLTDADGANLYLKTDTGSISGTIRTEKVFYAKSSTGSVKVPEGTSGGRCEAETSTGSIRLSISGQ